MTQQWLQIFDGADLEVYASVEDGHEILAITFDFSSVRGRPPHIPASHFFHDLAFDHIHITSKQDIWYQTSELLDVAGLINKSRSKYREVVTYGNSMGAYGSILMSGFVDAGIVLAFAPQYSVNPLIFPGETRWADAVRKISFLYDDLRSFVSARAKTYLVYDPFCPDDKRHVERYNEIGSFCEIKLPFCGHYPSSFLHGLALLPAYMEALIFKGTIDAALQRRMRSARRTSYQYFLNLALALQRTSRLDCAVRAAHAGYALAPDRPEALLTYVSLLAFEPRYLPFVHMAVRLLQTFEGGFPEYDGLREELWARIQNARGT